MKVYIKQKAFSWNDKFRVYDAYQADLFHAVGEFFSLEHKIHLYDNSDTEVALIRRKLWSFHPTYFVDNGLETVATIRREFTLLHPRFVILGLGWGVEGNFSEHEYEIRDDRGFLVASISRQWFTWGDTYEIDIPAAESQHDELVASVIGVVIAIDAIRADAQSSS